MSGEEFEQKPTKIAKHMMTNDRWFNEVRFGLFIHWGLYSIWGRGEWVQFKERIPLETYNKLADEFVPAAFDIDAWVALAKRAGAGYVVLTARHHDGFALFDSAVSEFTSVKTAAGRDFVREFVDACRRHGLRIGLYVSIMDWQFPACGTGPQKDPAGWEAMVRQTHEQVRELMTNYGQIDMVWYDGCMVPGIGDPALLEKFWRTKALNAMVRRLQPGILINDRAALPEDFATPEQEVAAPERGRRWEACMTLNGSWGYTRTDTNYKSVKEIVRHLVHCASHGGNLLLNIGPRGDGSVPAESVERLEAIGDWMRVNGEAIRNSTRTAFSEAAHVLGAATVCHDKVYFHLFDWQGGDAAVAGLNRLPGEARILGGPVVAFEKHGEGTWVARALPAAAASDGTGPAVLRLDSGIQSEPSILGGRPPPKELVSHAPVLAVRTGRHHPDHAPVIPATDLQSDLVSGCGATLQPGGDWCPGWGGGNVLAPEQGALDLFLDVPADGCFDLDLGVIAREPALLHLSLDGVSGEPSRRLRYGGYPDTVTFPRLRLCQGRRHLRLKTARGVPCGLYALRLSPVWLPLPSELWQTIGPFPTGWSVHAPLSEVKAALLTPTPAEGDFDSDQMYSGAAGLGVGWSWTVLRQGQRADKGVDFAIRCGIEASGVCLARTFIESPSERDVQILIGCDWWANVILNGERVQSTREVASFTQDGAWFNGWKPIPALLRLRPGANTLLVKCHPGSTANWFTCFINDPGDMKISPLVEEIGVNQA